MLFAYSPDETGPLRSTSHLDNATLAIEAGTTLMTFVAGLGILKGMNWARWLYATLFAVALVLDFQLFFGRVALLADAVFPTAFALILRGIIVTCLFLPDANDYFSASDSDRWD